MAMACGGEGRSGGEGEGRWDLETIMTSGLSGMGARGAWLACCHRMRIMADPPPTSPQGGLPVIAPRMHRSVGAGRQQQWLRHAASMLGAVEGFQCSVPSFLCMHAVVYREQR